MSAERRTIHSFWLLLSVTGMVLQAPALADSVPFWGAKASVPIDTPINGILTPGTTLFVTNEPLYPQTTGPMLRVVDADPPKY